MAHFCVFCERTYHSFTQLRYHSCTPASSLVTESFSDLEEDKENEVIILDKSDNSDEEMLGKDMTESVSIEHKPLSDRVKESFQGITDTAEEFTIELNKSFDFDKGDSVEMGETAVKEMDDTEPRYKSNNNGEIQKFKGHFKEINGNVKYEDGFVGECESADDSGSGSIEEVDSVCDAVMKNADGNTIDEDDFEESGYVYVFDTEENFIERDQTKQQLHENGDSGLDTTDSIGDENKDIGHSPMDRLSFQTNLNAESSSIIKNEPQLQTSFENMVGKGVNESNLESNYNQTNKVVTNLTSNPGPNKLVGASKRKRKFSLENTISQIIRTKTVCRDKMDCLNAFSDDEGKLVIDEVDMEIAPTVNEIVQPNKVLIQENSKTCFSVNDTAVLPMPVGNYDGNFIPKLRSSPDPFLLSQTKSNLSISKPVKPNRRKRSFVPRVKIVNEDISDEAFDYCNTAESSTVNVKEEVVNENGEVIDYSAATGEQVRAGKSFASHGFGNIEKGLNGFTINPISFKTSNNETKLVNGKQCQVKMEPMDLTVSSRNQTEMIDNKANMFAGMAADGPCNPVNQMQILDMMNKLQKQFPTANLMQANASYLQFQMWMQNMLLNSFRNAVNNVSKVMKNDHNENIVKKENNDMNATLTHDFQKFNLEFMQKNGLLHNNTVPPFAANQSMMQAFNAAAEANPVFTSKKKNIGGLAKLEMPVKSELDASKSMALNGVANMETNSVDEIKSADIGMNPALNGVFVKQTTGKKGEVQYHVKDNEQIQVIVSNLVQNGSLNSTEGMDAADLDLKYICQVCGQKFFHVEHLTRHIKKLHILKKFQCTSCERSFHDAGNFRQHMRVHDESDIPFECPECQRKFRHKCTLKVHMRIHSGEKPFKCEICQASFKISSGLQTHMRKHTGETPYACEFCNMRFKCQSNLKQHLFQHTQVKPFTCEVCGKSYSRKSIRDSHMQTHFK